MYSSSKKFIAIDSLVPNIKQDSVKVYFSILPKEINSCKGFDCFSQEINAIVEHTNISTEAIETSQTLIFGLKSEGDNHIETFKLNGKQVDFAREIDYHYTYDFYSETRLLKPSESIIDTIDLGGYYSFKQKGIFKIRFISTEFNAVSNWDTLSVK